MYRVTCSQCGASVVTEDGNSDRLACPCCPEPHSHEEAANGCPGTHDGDCALEAADCTVCRPCEITFVGTVPLSPVVVR
jgi:hypothetical protein